MQIKPNISLLFPPNFTLKSRDVNSIHVFCSIRERVFFSRLVVYSLCTVCDGSTLWGTLLGSLLGNEKYHRQVKIQSNSFVFDLISSSWPTMASKPQDLPPPGGYAKIPYKRIAAKGEKTFYNFLHNKCKILVLLILIWLVSRFQSTSVDCSCSLDILVSWLKAVRWTQMKLNAIFLLLQQWPPVHSTFTIWTTNKWRRWRSRIVRVRWLCCQCWWPNEIVNSSSSSHAIVTRRRDLWRMCPDGRLALSMVNQSSRLCLRMNSGGQIGEFAAMRLSWRSFWLNSTAISGTISALTLTTTHTLRELTSTCGIK